MSLYIIDEFEAREIARKFFEHHYSGMVVDAAVLMECFWLVDVWVSEPSPMKFQVKVSSKTGQIMEFFRAHD